MYRTNYGDIYVILQSFCKGGNIGLNDDTLGSIVKSSVAQYVALEITRSNGRDNRAVSKYFPWLCNTTTFQQGYGIYEYIKTCRHTITLNLHIGLGQENFWNALDISGYYRGYCLAH